jgi:hypothetical protein
MENSFFHFLRDKIPQKFSFFFLSSLHQVPNVFKNDPSKVNYGKKYFLCSLETVETINEVKFKMKFQQKWKSSPFDSFWIQLLRVIIPLYQIFSHCIFNIENFLIKSTKDSF